MIKWDPFKNWKSNKQVKNRPCDDCDLSGRCRDTSIPIGKKRRNITNCAPFHSFLDYINR